LTTPELQFIVDDCRPRELIYEDDFAESVDSLDVPVKLRLGGDFESVKASADPGNIGPVTATHDDPWAILYTSGTTGHPKGALVTHGMFFWSAINIGHAAPTSLRAWETCWQSTSSSWQGEFGSRCCSCGHPSHSAHRGIRLSCLRMSRFARWRRFPMEHWRSYRATTSRVSSE
jgi:acyl-coenzyme A synthetase/AMP-(fatty) acid ligase